MSKNDSKLKKFTKGVVIFLLGVFFSSLFTEIFNFTLITPIVTPIKNCLNPPFYSIRIDPVPNPIPKGNNSHIIRVNVINNGTKTLENIWIDYRLKCVTNDTKRAFLDTTFLLPGQRSYFEFETNGLNPNCSILPQPIIFKFYRDKEGREYLKVENSTSKVCMYCLLEINITADDFVYDYVYWYPYFEGEIELSGGLVSGLLSYEEAPNKTELIYIPEKDIRMVLLDMSIACLRGENLVWCRKYFRK